MYNTLSTAIYYHLEIILFKGLTFSVFTFHYYCFVIVNFSPTQCCIIEIIKLIFMHNCDIIILCMRVFV